jgi:anti-sigma factor ChrR (cupin superfamily)
MNTGIRMAALDGPWTAVRPGYEIQLLRVVSDTEPRALLLRLQPGIVIPRHRHQGEVHAINIAGHRKLLDTGEVERRAAHDRRELAARLRGRPGRAAMTGRDHADLARGRS